MMQRRRALFCLDTVYPDTPYRIRRLLSYRDTSLLMIFPSCSCLTDLCRQETGGTRILGLLYSQQREKETLGWSVVA